MTYKAMLLTCPIHGVYVNVSSTQYPQAVAILVIGFVDMPSTSGFESVGANIVRSSLE
jgi:hypothetical protein